MSEYNAKDLLLKQDIRISADDQQIYGYLSESWSNILNLAVPEVLSAILLVFLPIIFDLYFVSNLKHTISYQAMGLSSNVIHLLIKTSEAISVSVSTKVGFLNGASDYRGAGNFFINSFLASMLLGLFQVIMIFLCAQTYYLWIGAPVDVIPMAKTFLHTHSIAIFLSFLFMCLVGFFRGTKNTRIPLLANIFAAALFLVFDYILIFGKIGFPSMGLQGSAIASIIRYVGANIFLISYIFYSNEYSNYFKNINFRLNFRLIFEMLFFAIPIMIDKSIIAFAYIWLYKLVIPLGSYSLLALEVIKNLERLIFIPAHALAHVVNVLISNNVGENNRLKAIDNLKKILLVSVLIVSFIIMVMTTNAYYIVSIFDPQNLFRDETVFVFRCISGLVVIDVCQAIFASALRSTGNAYTVMLTRISFFSLFFFPATLIVKKISFASNNNKFLTFYGLLYLTIIIIGLYFFYKISQVLKTKTIKQ